MMFCPSSPVKHGATLLGIYNQNGTLEFLEDQLTIDQEFIESAQQGRPLSQRFRFANTCAQKGCNNWNGQKCTVYDQIKDILTKTEILDFELPKCSIRHECRWFLQEGSKACFICPKVHTEFMMD